MLLRQHISAYNLKHNKYNLGVLFVSMSGQIFICGLQLEYETKSNLAIIIFWTTILFIDKQMCSKDTVLTVDTISALCLC